MKNFAFLCVLFLVLSCSKEKNSVSKTEAFYIEKDSTTAYLGQKTVKVTLFDTVMNSICSSSFLKLENLTAKDLTIGYLHNNIFIGAELGTKLGSRYSSSAVIDLCKTYDCQTGCPNIEQIMTKLIAKYDSTKIDTLRTVEKYIEKDSTSAFFGKETLKLSTLGLSLIYVKYGTSSSYYSSKCLNNFLEIENLTEKQVTISINFYGPLGNEWKRVVIAPRQKSTESLDLVLGYFNCGVPYSGCCNNINQVLYFTKVTYN
ncbi:MAG: hypothetical protein JNL70_21245 [Saprospiraceae bacterium]|nr:hypothetical protein [Saprospiraceae bacterium]